ncbi:hypothetical protein [Chitinophaga nivalis]|uniref:Uncharacterized protein n=1 Tax=Chitinophaga nivalis TaxID=2991709 RepID=A0ABT3IP84_9BACT|nr:hypothetical protein [Chitinophaga nivalis]MCW3464523.1 hypothetical protein [Chitinophaga nivalis]MCW3485786.1 hypothetical protein [Chitinophaga nivalis]
MSKQYTSEEIAASTVFPGPTDPEIRGAMLAEFRIWRKKIAGEQSAESKYNAQLLQQRFLMEDTMDIAPQK